MITHVSKLALKSLTRVTNLGQIFKSVIKVTKLKGAKLEVSKLEADQLGVAKREKPKKCVS